MTDRQLVAHGFALADLAQPSGRALFARLMADSKLLNIDPTQEASLPANLADKYPVPRPVILSPADWPLALLPRGSAWRSAAGEAPVSR